MIETRLRNTGDQGGGGGGSANSSGLAGTGSYYIISSADALFPNALVIQPGSSVTHHITGSNYYVNATTSTFTGSSGLAGNANYYLMTSAAGPLANSLVIQPGSSVTHHITGSNYFINATTSGGGGSSTRDMFFYRSIGTSTYFSEKVMRTVGAGNNSTCRSVNFGTIQADTMYFAPLIMTRSGVTNKISYGVVATGLNAICQLAIYTNSSDTQYYPYQLISSSGFMSGSNNGVKNWFVTETLSQNTLYWVAINIGTGNPQLRTQDDAESYPLISYSLDSNFNMKSFFVLYNMFSNGLPITVGTGGDSDLGYSTYPYLGVSFSA